MFVFKKNSYTVMLLSKFLFKNCLLNFVVFAIVSYCSSVGWAIGSWERFCFVSLPLLVLHVLWFVKVMLDRRRWGAFLPKPLAVVSLVANVYWVSIEGLLVYLTAKHYRVYFPNRFNHSFLPGIGTCVDFVRQAGGFLSSLIVISLACEFVLVVLLVFRAATGSIVQFYLKEEGKVPVYDLKRTIDGKTGVQVVSSVPEYNRVVDVEEGCLSITAADDLLVVECGEGGDNAVVIPKESVKFVTFTTLAGWKKKVGYSGGVWKQI